MPVPAPLTPTLDNGLPGSGIAYYCPAESVTFGAARLYNNAIRLPVAPGPLTCLPGQPTSTTGAFRCSSPDGPVSDLPSNHRHS